MNAPAHLTTEQLELVAREVVAVVRHHAPTWTEPPERDPGITLVSLLTWLADLLAFRQLGDTTLRRRRALGTLVHHVLADTPVVVTVDGVRQEPAGSPSDASGAGYVLSRDTDGTATVVFGDGRTGGRLPEAGSEVVVTYRWGSGAATLTTAAPWPPEPLTLVVRFAGHRVSVGPAPPGFRRALRCLWEAMRG